MGTAVFLTIIRIDFYDGSPQVVARVVTGLEDYRSRASKVGVGKRLEHADGNWSLQVDMESPVGGMVARETFRTGFVTRYSLIRW